MSLNLLTSYIHFSPAQQRKFRAVSEAMGDDFSLFLDSGAFTAFQKGTTIDVEEYCAALANRECPVDRYFMLDVIGDPSGTRRNLDVMLAHDLKPIPVVTRGDDLSALDDYFAVSDLVALGSIARATTDAAQWAHAMWKHANGRALHLLGVTRVDLLKRFPTYSVDSSSWQQPRRFGGVMLYDGHGGIFAARDVGDSRLLPRKVEQCIRRFGFDAYQVFNDHDKRRGLNSVSQRISLMSWLAFADDLRRLKGTRLYFALPASEDLGFVCDVYNQFKEWRTQ